MPLLQLSQGHCQYFFPSLFLSPSLLFPITPTVLRPHLSFFHLGRIEREGRAALSLPKTLPPHHFLLIWFEGSTHLPLPPPFPPLLRLPVFLLTFPEKSKFTPPPRKTSFLLLLNHFSNSSHKCLTRSVWDFQQHPSFVFVSCLWGFTKASLEGWRHTQAFTFIYCCYVGEEMTHDVRWTSSSLLVYWFIGLFVKSAGYYPCSTCLLQQHCTYNKDDGLTERHDGLN